jgi:SH3-like domain-containing protein
VIEVIHDAIAAALERRSLDRRTCFTAVRTDPMEAQTIVVECSDGGVLGDIRERIIASDGDRGTKVVFVELPDPGAGLPELFVASASVVDVRRQASHGAELVTQLVYGDAVLPLKRDGEWVVVRLDDGYVGWVRSWHLKPLRRREYEAVDRTLRHRVRDNVIAVYEAADEASCPVSDAVMGTPMRAEPCARRGWRQVTLPDGKQGFVKAGVLEGRPRAARPNRRPRRRSAVLRRNLASTANRFLGIPYVWGGTTPKGFDCSGLTQRVYRLQGTLIPRDSDMQARFGAVREAGDADGLLTGELLFFGSGAAGITHVGMYLSNGLFIHARGIVRVNALFPSHPLFDEELTRAWRLTGDPIAP